MEGNWKRENINLCLSSNTYFRNLIPKFEELYEMTIKRYKTPMPAGYHPELDQTEYLNKKHSAIFRSIIGSLNWLIILGRWDIYYATNTLGRFGIAPRSGHMRVVFRKLGYLRKNPDGKTLFDTKFHKQELHSVKDVNWKEAYPYAEEKIPYDAPEPKGNMVRMTIYVDANHTYDQATRRSVAGILIFLNNTPICWVSKRQKTVETSTYGSEMVAAIIAVELVLEIRYQLRMLGIKIDGPAQMFGDNSSVIISCTTPSSVLKKKHLSLTYHRVREACAAGAINFNYIASDDNYADVLTKPLATKGFYKLTQPWLFGIPK